MVRVAAIDLYVSIAVGIGPYAFLSSFPDATPAVLPAARCNKCICPHVYICISTRTLCERGVQIESRAEKHLFCTQYIRKYIFPARQRSGRPFHRRNICARAAHSANINLYVYDGSTVYHVVFCVHSQPNVFVVMTFRVTRGRATCYIFVARLA
jgi:hypothetical protein